MPRSYRSSQASINWAIRRGWAYSRQEFSDFLADVFNACCEQYRPFVCVIQPRTTCQVEWSTASMVPDGQSAPKVAAPVMEDIDRRAEALQKRSRSRNKSRASNPTGGTIYGLREDDAKFLAAHIAQVLNDPATFTAGKVVSLFTIPEGQPA